MENYEDEFTFTVNTTPEMAGKITGKFSNIVIATIGILMLGPTLSTILRDQNGLGIFGIIPIGMIALFIAVMMHSIAKANKKNLETNKLLFKPQEYTFSKDFMKIKTESSESTQRWDSFLGYEEKDKYFAIYVSANSFYLIPKDSFANESEIERARGYFSKLPAYSLSKSLPLKTANVLLIALLVIMFIFVIFVAYLSRG